MDTATITTVGLVGGALIGAMATGTVLVIKAVGENQRKQLDFWKEQAEIQRQTAERISHAVAVVDTNVNQVHGVVNSAASALKEQNERILAEATRLALEKAKTEERVTSDKVAQAFKQGLAEGIVQGMREAGPGTHSPSSST